MKKNLFSLFFILVVLILSGCSTFQKVVPTTNPVELSESNSTSLTN
jgi:uncharacterized lipoprotein YajG